MLGGEAGDAVAAFVDQAGLAGVGGAVGVATGDLVPVAVDVFETAFGVAGLIGGGSSARLLGLGEIAGIEGAVAVAVLAGQGDVAGDGVVDGDAGGADELRFREGNLGRRERRSPFERSVEAGFRCSTLTITPNPTQYLQNEF